MRPLGPLSRGASFATVSVTNTRGIASVCDRSGNMVADGTPWTRLSCRKFRDNAVRLQLHALAYNLANFMRTLALPKAA